MLRAGVQEHEMFDVINYAVGHAVDRAMTFAVPVVVPGLALSALLDSNVVSVLVIVVANIIAVEWGVSRRLGKTALERLADERRRKDEEMRQKLREESLDKQARDALAAAARAEKVAGDARVEVERLRHEMAGLRDDVKVILDRTSVLDRFRGGKTG